MNTFHLLFYILVPITAAFIHYFFHNTLSKGFILVTQTVLMFNIMVSVVKMLENDLYQNSVVNVPLPYGMKLEMDSISLVFMFINVLLFSVTLLFAYQKPYFKPNFILIFLSLEGILNAIFLSTDLFNVYVLLEITTVLATLLIMSQSENKSVYHALMYLMSNLVAMAFFLLGLGFLYKLTGFLDYEHIKAALYHVENRQNLILPFALIFTGISLKAAVFPLFSWLPKAHAAPSAPSTVSAILSGILVKSGIYVLIRLQMLFGEFLPSADLILFLGYVTTVVGFIFAISQTKIKLILAYHTVSQMGLILIGLGYGELFTLNGALYHVMSHGIFKPLLFLISGLLINHYHTHEIKEMQGLWRTSKPLSMMLLVAVFSITGAPFFSGAISKSLIGSHASAWAMHLISMGTMISFIKFFKILWPKKNPLPNKFDKGFDLFPAQWLALGSLSCLSLILGIMSKPMLSLFLHLDYTVTVLDLFTKGIDYVLLYGSSIVLYHFVLSKLRTLDLLQKVDLTFNQSSIAIMIYFAGVLAYFTK